jgi:hypothetical protein
VAVERGCRECLTEGYTRDGAPMGVHRGFVAREMDGTVDWRPCFGCNRERWTAWQTGETAPAPTTSDDQPSAAPTEVRKAWRAAVAAKPTVPADNETVEDKARRRAQLDAMARLFGTEGAS